jgi:hypothetical protein
VAIWTIAMESGARWQLPPARRGSSRVLYFFRGAELEVAGEVVPRGRAVHLEGHAEIELEVRGEAGEVLLLQGQPIGEPVVQHGPFVMNTPAEIYQAMADYQRTEFGGWPWPSHGPVHARGEGRFAIHASGEVERPAAGEGVPPHAADS